MLNNPQIQFRAKAVEPIECIKGGWALIKDQYWLFVGITVVGMLIGSAIPLGILLGPMMCGIYLSLLQKRRGSPVEFGNLFKGFDNFGQSVIATLLHMIPIMVILIPAYILFYVGFVVTVLSMGNDTSGAPFIIFVLLMVLFWLVVAALIMVISIGFTFTFPLIVDRGVPGFDAVKLSFRAAIPNFWRLLGLSMLNFLLSLGGVLLCYVGAFLVLPISFAALAMAYEQVFSLRQPGELIGNFPPPPPSFS